MNDKPPIDFSGIDRRNVRYLLSGILLGTLWTIWMIPAEALDIPTEMNRSGTLIVSYYPITNSMIMVLFCSLFGIFLTFRYRHSRQSEISDFAESQSND